MDKEVSFEKFASWAAIATGGAVFFYAVSFMVISRTDPQAGPLLSSFFLLLQGLLSTVVFTAVYLRLKAKNAGFALWALILALVGALGAVIHGGYDLANAINPPYTANLDRPNAADPRGLLTFGFSGLAIMFISLLISDAGGRLSRSLSLLGYGAAILSLALYFGRLIALQATSPVIMYPALVNGFVLLPTWYILLGLDLQRD